MAVGEVPGQLIKPVETKSLPFVSPEVYCVCQSSTEPHSGSGTTRLASLKYQFQGVWLCLMKGGDISTHRNGLLMEDSSAVLNTFIRYAVIAEERLSRHRASSYSERFERWRLENSKFPIVDYAGCLIKIYSDLHAVIHFHLLSPATEQLITIQTFHFQMISQRKRCGSPWASKAGKTWMGGLVDEWLDDTLHHVRQHSEGGHHDEVNEPWWPRYQKT